MGMIEAMEIQVLGTMGKRIALLRKERDMSGIEFAKALEVHGVQVSPSHISKIENGHVQPSVEVLRAMCAALGISANYLLLLSDVPETPTTDGDAGDVRAYSEEGEEAARIVDALTPMARATVLSHMRLVMQEQTTLAESARASMAQFAAQIKAGGLVLSEAELGAIATLVRDLTGIDVALPGAPNRRDKAR